MPRPRKARDDGFTLVELLFVVFILAVLVGLALASYSTASSRARATTCLVNQRALSDAAVEYQTDHAGSMPTDIADLEPYVANYDAAVDCPSDAATLLVLDSDTGQVS